MLTAKIGKEIVVETLNQAGLLDEMARTLSEKGISVLGVSGGVKGHNAVIRLITDDNVRAMDALRRKNYSPAEAEVIVVDLPHRPGMLRQVTERLCKAEIDILHVYGTAEMSSARGLLILSTPRNEHAVVVLNTQ